MKKALNYFLQQAALPRDDKFQYRPPVDPQKWTNFFWAVSTFLLVIKIVFFP